MSRYVLAIDQGTSSSRAILFDADMRRVTTGRKEIASIYPASGWVEQDAEEIWSSVVWSMKAAIAEAGIAPSDIAAIGITNQRETTIVWDKATGEPIHNAIVWQDRRTAALCNKLRRRGHEAEIARKTGLLIDPYFSATKIRWMLDHIRGARRRAERGELLAGTVDSFLIWRLTGGRIHATDATNASRTMLYNIAANDWDDDLLRLFGVPRSMLPQVLDSAAEFGVTDSSVIGAGIPVLGIAGDQQAATLGQACFAPGMMKATYGTGCFALLNTGADMVRSRNRLLTTIAYRLDGQTTYALEGSIFVAGAAVQWLCDGLGIIKSAADSDRLAAGADAAEQVYLVPAFVGLGAPYWDADARGAIFGLTRDSGASELARAALESVVFQTRDLLDAMRRDWRSGEAETVLRVDGGMAASDWTMQRLADILDVPVDRPIIHETTALGAAWLAASFAGLWPDKDGFARAWTLERRFMPDMDDRQRKRLLKGWRDAVRRTMSNA